MSDNDSIQKSITGTLLGTAAGDSIGLPSEGMSPRRIKKRWPGPLKQRLILGRGMVSDDTEHTVFVAQSLIAHPSDAKKFQRFLAWKLRWWMLTIPAGIGFATLRAILKLWTGFPASHSGIYSAGNGPAMRSAILGVFFRDDPEALTEYVTASTRLTHTDSRANTGALAVALCARCPRKTRTMEGHIQPRATTQQHPKRNAASLQACMGTPIPSTTRQGKTLTYTGTIKGERSEAL
jgi:ADP-ribosylglycohydrolase